MELSGTARVILGMLALGKRTGYEIKALVDVSTRFFWAASYGQIYPELARLEEAGLVAGERDPADSRRRKSYELTPAGEAALRDWLGSDEPLQLEMRHEGALRLFFSDVLGPDARLEQVKRIRAAHEEVGEQLRLIRSHFDRPPDSGRLLCLEWGIALQDFMTGWCDEAERRLTEAPAPAGQRS